MANKFGNTVACNHVYTPRVLLQAHSETQEKALWSAVVALEESATLVRAIVPDFAPDVAARLEQQVQKKLIQAAEVRRILKELELFETD